MINPDLERILKELPEVAAGKDVWQNPFHEFDVYGHTISYVEHLKQLGGDFEMIVAGYLHDIGKPVVRKPRIKDGVLQEKEPGKPYHTFEDHEDEGEKMVRAMDSGMFKKYGVNQERVAKLVGAHYAPMKAIKEMRAAKHWPAFVLAYGALEETLDNTGLDSEDVMTMFLADKLAQGKGCTDMDELMLVREAILTGGKNLRNVYDVQKKMYGGKE